MNKPLLPFLILSAIMILSSCGARSTTDFRYLRTGLDPQDRVVILLNQYIEHGDTNESQDKENAVESCIRDGLRYENSTLKVIPAKDFRKTVFRDITFAPRSADDLLLYLRDEANRNRMSGLSIRYIIVVDIRTYNTNERWSGSGDELGFAFGKEWRRNSAFNAVILDAKNLEKSGQIIASSEGPVVTGLAVFVIIPIPIIWFSRTENEACLNLARSVDSFIISDAEPDPEKNPYLQTAPEPEQNAEPKADAQPGPIPLNDAEEFTVYPPWYEESTK